MSETPATSVAAAHSGPSRLNTWKEIAAYLGKGVRTAERWEAELGLPVHRVRTGRGESVYALTSEIEAWLAAKDGGRPGDDISTRPSSVATRHLPLAPTSPEHTPARRRARTRPYLIAALAVVSFAVLWFTVVSPRIVHRTTAAAAPSASNVAASWRLADGQVVVLDQAGRQLWTTHLPFKLDAASYSGRATTGTYVALEDLDGDGRRELLFIAWDSQQQGRGLYCYNSDGTLRFAHEPKRGPRFGDLELTPPLTTSRIWLTKDPGGRQAIWLAANHVLGPCVVEKIDPSGAVLSEYWGYGHVAVVQDAMVAGRRVALIGAVNNESHGSSLAVVDYDNAAATAPAAAHRFQCADCPGGPPLQFFVFPQDDVSHVAGSGRTQVDLVVLNAIRDHMIVRSSSGGPIGTDTQATEWNVFYTFDQAFNLTDVKFTENYRGVHARLRELGVLDHPLGPRDHRDVERVLRWDGARFAPVQIKGAAAAAPASH